MKYSTNAVSYTHLDVYKRQGELAALKWEDIDWENGTLHIQRIETRAFTQDTSTTQKKSYITVKERTKTESSNRYIDLTDLTLETLRQIKELNPDGEYLFEEKHRRINAHSFRKRLYDLCAQTNIERKSPHCVRRYEASKMLSNGVDAVSYTHLDVYKRQFLSRHYIDPFFSLF